jgi:hypothetical protein
MIIMQESLIKNNGISVITEIPKQQAPPSLPDLLREARKGLQGLFHPLSRYFLGCGPPPPLPKKRGDLEEILHQRTLRPVEGTAPDEGAVLNPQKMEVESHRCRLFDGIGNPFALAESINISQHNAFRPKLGPHIAQDLTEGSREGFRRYPPVDPGNMVTGNNAEFPALFQLLQKKGLHCLFWISGKTRGIENCPAERTTHRPPERVFRSDLLKGYDSDPVLDDLPLGNRHALFLTVMAAHDDGQQERYGKKPAEAPAKNGRSTDDLSPHP